MQTLIASLLIIPMLAAAAGEDPRASGADAEPGVSAPLERPQRTRRPRSATSRVVRMVAYVVAIYVGFVVLVLLLENYFIYYPMRYPVGEWESHGLSVEDCSFKAQDGVELHAWWQQGARTDKAPVLLWFHGNAGNVTHRADNLRMLADRDVDVLIVDYRGYGKSAGHPNEEGLYLDGEAAYRYLIDERGIAPERIVCWGRSIGASVALQVACNHRVAGVVLESPFASARAMAGKMMPFVPIGPFIRSSFDSVGMVSKLEVPVLVMHGDRDRIVPFRQGRAVFEAATEPKEFYKIVGAGHNDTYLVGGEPYFEAFVDFCRRCVRLSP